MFKLKFSKTEISNSYLGGSVFLNSNIFFENESENFILFLTLDNDFFPSKILSNEEIIVVLIDRNYFDCNNKIDVLNRVTLNNENQKKEYDEQYFKIIKCKKGGFEFFNNNENIIPKLYLRKNVYTEDDFEKEFEYDEIGAKFSKFLGVAGYLKDPINFGVIFDFELQFFESDLCEVDDKYMEIFNGGALYIYISKRIKKINYNENVGKLFIQY